MRIRDSTDLVLILGEVSKQVSGEDSEMDYFGDLIGYKENTLCIGFQNIGGVPTKEIKLMII